MSEDWVWPANNIGLEFYGLSIPWGHGVANWPYFEDVKIERVHDHGESRVLTQRITSVMHSATPKIRAGDIDIDSVTGKRVTFAALPWHWVKGVGCIIRLAAILDPSAHFRMENGSVK